MPAPSPTLSADNGFRFVCPSLGVEAKLADCLTLRDRVWRGEKPPERRGCQVCMISSKCAAAQIVHDMWIHKVEPPYHSATPKVGTLDQKLVDQINRVVIFEKTLDAYAVDDAERTVLLAGNDAAGKAARRIADIDTSNWAQSKVRSRSARTPRATKAPDTDTVAAAMSGDLSAAVTQAAAVTPKPRKPEPAVTPAPAPAGLSLMERARLAKKEKAA